MNLTPTLTAPRHIGLMGVLALLLGVASGAVASAATPSGADAGALLKRIEQGIGTPSCQRDSDCRTLAIGQKSCGGPEAHLPWSTRTVPTPEGQKALSDLARQHAQARAAAHQASGMMSNCSVLPDPGATCKAQRCVLREAAPLDPSMVPR